MSKAKATAETKAADPSGCRNGSTDSDPRQTRDLICGPSIQTAVDAINGTSRDQAVRAAHRHDTPDYQALSYIH